MDASKRVNQRVNQFLVRAASVHRGQNTRLRVRFFPEDPEMLAKKRNFYCTSRKRVLSTTSKACCLAHCETPLQDAICFAKAADSLE